MDSRQFERNPKTRSMIRFQDCDPFGHLNTGRYIDYFINAREDHLARFYDFDIYERQKKTQDNWLITGHQIAYVHPALFREEVTIGTALIQYTENSILMEGVMLDKEEKQLKSVIWTSFRLYSFAEGRPLKHSKELMSFWSEIAMEVPAVINGGFVGRVIELRHRFCG